jgi:hypothetical protein
VPNWDPRRALSGLFFRGEQSDPDEPAASPEPVGEEIEETDGGEEQEPLSPLMMMDERRPEAWLGQFLLSLDLGRTARFGTIEGAKRDPKLIADLKAIAETAGATDPLRLLDPQAADTLRQTDWAAWFRAQEDLLRYAYVVLALSLLRQGNYTSALRAMYQQEANSRVRKDAHYVLTYLLGKDWPAYRVTDADFDRLNSASQNC